MTLIEHNQMADEIAATLMAPTADLNTALTTRPRPTLEAAFAALTKEIE